jgi:hypothetical protein
VTITVIGQKGTGPVLRRTVTPDEFFDGWGPWAGVLLLNAQHTTLVIEGHRIRLVVNP